MIESVVSLQGIPKIAVAIITNDEMLLTKNNTHITTLKNEVELKLRQSGIIVDNSDNAQNCLLIKVQLFNEGDLYLIYITADLYQPVVLMNNKTVIHASTWQTGFYGFAMRMRLAENVKEAISNINTAFLNAYLEANPPIKPTAQPTPEPTKTGTPI